MIDISFKNTSKENTFTKNNLSRNTTKHTLNDNKKIKIKENCRPLTNEVVKGLNDEVFYMIRSSINNIPTWHVGV